jgi:hypothetical protein
VALAGAGDLDHLAAGVEVAHGVAGAPGGGELERARQLRVRRAADGVEARRAQARVLEGGPRPARLVPAIAAALADQDQPGAGAPGAVESGGGVAVTQQPCLVDDPQPATALELRVVGE